MQAIDETIEGGSTTERRSKCTGKPEPGGTAVQCTSAAGKGKIETTKLDTALEEIMDMGEEVNLELMLRGEENGYGFPQG